MGVHVLGALDRRWRGRWRPGGTPRAGGAGRSPPGRANPTRRRDRVTGGTGRAVVDRADAGMAGPDDPGGPPGDLAVGVEARAGASRRGIRRPGRSRSSTTRSTGPRRRGCAGLRRPARRRGPPSPAWSRMHGGGTRRTGNLDDGIVAVVELGAEGLGHHGVLEVQRRDVGELEDGDLVEVAAAARRRGRRGRGRGRRRGSRCRRGRHARRRCTCPPGRRVQAGMCVICASGMPSSRIDLACWLKTNWLPAAHPARIWPSSRSFGVAACGRGTGRGRSP